MQMLADALAAHQAGRLPEAECGYRRVLQAAPDQPSALYLYGRLALATARPAIAAGLLHRAVAARPDHLASLLALAHALLAARDPAAALDAADAALARQPAPALTAEAQFLRGTALNALARPADALAALDDACRLAPGHASAWLNRGNALADLDRLAEAEASLRQAIALDATLAEAHASLGFVLTGRGRLAEAIGACADATDIDPACAQAHWNESFARLLAGDYAQGWEKYEWRKRHDRLVRVFPAPPGPEWQGEDLAGRSILVCAEQGLGDTIQMSRYLPLLAQRGARVRLVCDPRLAPLLAGLACITDRTAPLPPYDVWVDQMSLPRLFATTPDSIPAAGGWLRADPAHVAAWRARLPPGRRVGLVWRGNPAHSNDRRRSIPTAALAPLLAVPGVGFVSLQVGADPPAGIDDLSAHLTDFAQTAAAVAALDLVIAVDTSVAHLAGALGAPVWTLLPFAPDWRWLVSRPDDSPWYASMRLFRQASPGDWAGVIKEVSSGLCPAPRQGETPWNPSLK